MHIFSCFNRKGDVEIFYFHPITGHYPTLDNTSHLDAMYCLGSGKSYSPPQSYYQYIRVKARTFI